MQHVLNKIWLLFLPFFGFAQTSNNWINYSQKYFKVKITQEGIYRLDSATLSNAGVPLNLIDARNLQLFGRGNEIALYIEGENDGVFNASDFLEFYAMQNDGWLDHVLYNGSINNPNPYYSLYTDTASYFLTWNNSINNKRVSLETDVNFNSYTPSSFFWKESTLWFNNVYYPGKISTGGSTDVDFIDTEGWMNNAFNKGDLQNFNVPTLNAYSAGPNAKAKIVVTGQSNFNDLLLDHHLQIHYGPGLTTAYDTTYEGYLKLDLPFSIPANQLNTSTLIRAQSIPDLPSPNYVDRSAVSFVKIEYPHTSSLSNASVYKFWVDDDLQGKTRLDISNFNSVGNPILYDLTNNKRIIVVPSGPIFQTLIPNNTNLKECFITSPAAVTNLSSLTPVNGNGFFTDYAAQNIDSAFIIITHPLFNSEAQSYATYRSISGQNTIVVNIEELYDQYAYGISKHPLSISYFIKNIINSWNAPQNLLLIGKSTKHNIFRKDPSGYNLCHVPSFGYPASDTRLASFLNPTWNPIVATGRISAQIGNDVMVYLNKVIEHESNTTAEWMKQILHFAGGTNQSEVNLFEGVYLNSYKTILEDTSFGGNVKTFKKFTTAPVQTNLADSIKQFISNGVSIMTFFGHASSSGGFDQSVDNPASWNNKGKYPFLLGNSCYAGDIHNYQSSVSEQFTLIAERGVIGFMASVDLGFASLLHAYSNEFFRQLGQVNYGKHVGLFMNNSIENLYSLGSFNDFYKSVALEMTLHGDPSIRINPHPQPDYMLHADNVFFSPEDITTETDSFEIKIIVTNLGKAINAPFDMEVRRTFPDIAKSDTVYTKIKNATYYKDTIIFKMPVDIVSGIGLNQFEIKVDASSSIAELNEFNNDLLLSKTIRSGDVWPIYPYQYAIVPQQGIKLVASTGFAFEKSRNYIFELDTTDLFNSPLKQTHAVYSAGGVLEWKPSLLNNMPDTMVYFWRVSKDSVDATGYNWRESSFQHISGKRGWSQDHFFQFKNDSYLFLKHNRNTLKFEFANNEKKLFCQNIGNPPPSQLGQIHYNIDTDLQDYQVCGLTPSMHIAVVDSLSLVSWGTYGCELGSGGCGNCNMVNANHQFNNVNNGCNCRSRVEKYFIFRTNDQTQLIAMRDMLNNSIPNGNYILAYSAINPLFSVWDSFDPSIKQAFINLGSDSLINTPNDSLPYIFMTKKGYPSTTIETLGQNKFSTITQSLVMQSNSKYGFITSEIIGPAFSWDSLFWKVQSLENSSTKDSTFISIIGINWSGQQTTLYSDLPEDSAKIRLTETIDANLFPYLKLLAQKSDDSLYTAPQLDYWRVTYEPVPEAALAPNIYFSIHNDTLQEGDPLKFLVAVKNVSEFDMDSLLIAYKIYDRFKNTHPVSYPKQAPLKADSVMISTMQFNTIGFPALNNIYVEVNPNNDQPEQYHFNNIGQYPFYVKRDKQNPLLNITFDGVHILDGDIVSPTPEIIISLTDENKFLALNDTADYSIYIINPKGQQERIWFKNYSGADVLHFQPASLPKNSARITYQPTFVFDGVYQLRIQATDRSKNAAGKIDYIISFEVINKSTITHILNYPNPFTTSTRFVFTLTGSKIPDVFNIQIMTITGTVVKEISKDELGPIRIGRNITEYVWDGTDQFGDRLANGLYLYRVFTRIENNSIEHKSNEADAYFHKGYGKMYLFR
ncbi:MAG: hypothetical protein HUU48_09760 [Flavobacteriales bacterium]|nr:hypothetical protein [Flavobacteriales bacterium]